MGKFCNSHLYFKDNKGIYFGSADDAFIVFDGTDLTVDVPIRGEQATEYFHLVRFDQLTTASGYLQDQIDSISQTVLDWQNSVLTISGGPPPPSPSDGDRYLIDGPTASGAWSGNEDSIAEWSTASGTWIYQTPNPGFATYVEDEETVYLYDGSTWEPFGVNVDHGNLTGLDDDDHPQYILVDGSRGFTNTVSGVDPTQDYHLATKSYVDQVVGGQGPFVTISGNETITGDKVFDNNLTTFLGDVFFDGIEITMSGTTLNTEANAVFNYDSTSTVNHYGDVTFSGTTTFETPTYFNDDIYYGDNVISGTGDIYAGNIYADNITSSGIIDLNRKWGRMPVISGAVSQAVTFDNSFPDDNYTLVATLTNEVDSPPCIYSTIQGVKTASGFTTHFSGDIENGNYILEWIAEYNQQS